MDAREERGRELAKRGKIESLGKAWLVSSQTSAARYVVRLDQGTCTCPDHEQRGIKCKHQFAVEFSLKEEKFSDGSTATTKTVRMTYSQDWPRYNAAQCAEKETVQTLLRALCDGIVTPPHPGRGPKPIARIRSVNRVVTQRRRTAISFRDGTRKPGDLGEAGRAMA